jgi:hypothetical protein
VGIILDAFLGASPTDNFAPLVILRTDLCSVTQLRGMLSEEADTGHPVPLESSEG